MTDASTPRPPLLRLTLDTVLDGATHLVVAADVQLHCDDADDMAATLGGLLRVAAELGATALARGDLTPGQLSGLVEDALRVSDGQPAPPPPLPAGPPRFPGVL